MSRRTKRIEHLIQREISNIILIEVSDPRLEKMTITDVKVAPDLKNATVFYTVFGDEEDRKSIRKSLRKSTHFIQHYLVERLDIRYSPKIRFEYDETIDRAFEIEKKLDSIVYSNNDYPVSSDE